MQDLIKVFRAAAIKKVPKVWGIEYWLVNVPEYCSKLLVVNAGFQCSLHYHIKKRETFVLLAGDIDVTLRGGPDFTLASKKLSEGERCEIFPGLAHRFSSDNGAALLEISTHHDDSDVVRIAPSRRL